MNRKHFTLVELLVVIAIIGVLAGILIPTIGKSLEKADAAKCKSEITTLVSAIKQYEGTYGHMPIPADWKKGKANENVELSDAAYEWLIKLLQGASITDETFGKSSVYNPRDIKFLDPQGNENLGTFVDPWDNRYHIVFDADYDGKCKPSTAIPGLIYDSEGVRAAVVIWSAGPDTATNSAIDNKQNKDNIYSLSTVWRGNGNLITK